jgi:hypothetical protein
METRSCSCMNRGRNCGGTAWMFEDCQELKSFKVE